MKTILNFVVLIALSIPSALSQNSVAESTFTLNYDDNLSKLFIEYTMNYTAPQVKKDTIEKTIFEKNFGSAMTQEQNNSNSISKIQSEIIQIISKNPGLKLEPTFPKEVLQIIDLIDDENKREKARQIYINANQDKLMTTGQHVEITSRENDYTKKIKITYFCRIRINKKTILNIPSFSLFFDNKVFLTNPLVISFQVD